MWAWLGELFGETAAAGAAEGVATGAAEGVAAEGVAAGAAEGVAAEGAAAGAAEGVAAEGAAVGVAEGTASAASDAAASNLAAGMNEGVATDAASRAAASEAAIKTGEKSAADSAKKAESARTAAENEIGGFDVLKNAVEVPLKPSGPSTLAENTFASGNQQPQVRDPKSIAPKTAAVPESGGLYDQVTAMTSEAPAPQKTWTDYLSNAIKNYAKNKIGSRLAAPLNEAAIIANAFGDKNTTEAGRMIESWVDYLSGSRQDRRAGNGLYR